MQRRAERTRGGCLRALADQAARERRAERRQKKPHRSRCSVWRCSSGALAMLCTGAGAGTGASTAFYERKEENTVNKTGKCVKQRSIATYVCRGQPGGPGSRAQAEGAARQIQASYRRHSTLSGAEGAAAVVAQASGGSHGASPAEDRGGGAVIKAGRKTPKSAAARRKQREMAGANGNLSAAGRRPRKARAPETLPS